MPGEGDLVESACFTAACLQAMGFALARLEALESLTALAGDGERLAALREVGVAAIELQRGLLLGALDALQPGLRGEKLRAGPRRCVRRRLLASSGRALLRVGQQRDAARANREARRERLAGQILLVGAHFAHALQGEGE